MKQENTFPHESLIFSLPGFRELAGQLAQAVTGLMPGRYDYLNFPNSEVKLVLGCRVEGKHCLTLGSISPPEEEMLEFFLLNHTLKKEKAAGVTAIIPYLAYSRQEKIEPLLSRATAWIAQVFQASGVDELVSVDLHSKSVRELFPFPVISLSPAALLASQIKQTAFADAAVAAPDEGARERAGQLLAALDRNEPAAYFVKKRQGDKISSTLQGEVGNKVVLVDDILDTGGTLVRACETLQAGEVKRILVAVSHGLFTGELWRRLFRLGVEKIITTDTTPSAVKNSSDKITVLSVASLISDYLNLELTA